MRHSKGNAAAQYGLVLALVVLVCVGAASFFGTTMNNNLTATGQNAKAGSDQLVSLLDTNNYPDSGPPAMPGTAVGTGGGFSSNTAAGAGEANTGGVSGASNGAVAGGSFFIGEDGTTTIPDVNTFGAGTLTTSAQGIQTVADQFEAMLASATGGSGGGGGGLYGASPLSGTGTVTLPDGTTAQVDLAKLSDMANKARKIADEINLHKGNLNGSDKLVGGDLGNLNNFYADFMNASESFLGNSSLNPNQKANLALNVGYIHKATADAGDYLTNNKTGSVAGNFTPKTSSDLASYDIPVLSANQTIQLHVAPQIIQVNAAQLSVSAPIDGAPVSMSMSMY